MFIFSLLAYMMCTGKAQFEHLREQKIEMENEYDEQVKKWEEDHGHRVLDMEAYHNHMVCGGVCVDV